MADVEIQIVSRGYHEEIGTQSCGLLTDVTPEVDGEGGDEMVTLTCEAGTAVMRGNKIRLSSSDPQGTSLTIVEIRVSGHADYTFNYKHEAGNCQRNIDGANHKPKTPNQFLY